MTPQFFEYLEALKANNDRPWFNEHKAEYEYFREMWLTELQRLLDRMSADVDPRLGHLTAKDCTYRIYRDTRFSPDKTPYKTYFSALVSPRGRKLDRAAYYIHAGVDECVLYGGLWNPESKVLKKVRKAIVDNIEEFRGIIDAPDVVANFPGWEGRSLKTVPKGYDRNDPNADLLRLVDIGKGHPVGRKFFERPNWPEEAARLLGMLQPMLDFLNYSIDE